MRYDETDGIKEMNKWQLNDQHYIKISTSIHDVYNDCACSVCKERQSGEL